MRDLRKYPITIEEVKAVMGDVCLRENDNDRIGSTDAYILGRICDLVEEKFSPKDFNP